MKLAAIIIFGLALQSSATVTFSQQRISLDLKNVPVRKVLKTIENRSDYRFVYGEDVFEAKNLVNIYSKNATIDYVMEQLLAGTGLSYNKLNETLVIIIGKETQQTLALPVKGRVTDEQGQPLSGVSIVEKGTTNGAVSNDQGKFAIEISSENVVLEVSRIGYETKEVVVSGSEELNILLIALKGSMQEVVVVGFGSQKKENLTGAVSSVNTELLESRPVSFLGHALQGTVPGLNLNVGGLGGQLGQTMNVNIRGVGTIGTGSNASPLILIDGIEGNMENLNPNDIASISVLKDAASSAIYGSRAAFGVILITTKAGRSGKMVLEYSNSFRYSGPANLPHQLNSWDFAHYFNEANANQGGGAIFDENTLSRIKQYMNGEITTTTIPNGNNWHFHQQANDNVNWWKTHFGWNWSKEHNLSLRGGTERLTYYASANILDQNGNLTYGKDHYKRLNLMARVNAKITNFLDFNINTKFIRFNLDNPLYSDMNGLLYHDILRMWPMMPFKDPNGFYMRNGKLSQLTEGGRAITRNDNLYAQGEFIIKPMSGWNIYVQGGTRIVNQNKSSFLAPVFEHDKNGNPLPLPFSADFSPGATFADEQYLNSNYYSTSIYSDYTFDVGRNNFKIMAGMNTEENKYRGLGARRSDLITAEVPVINAATGEDLINLSVLNDWATAGFFGRLNYIFDNRYLFEANLRYDGSSRFLRDQRWTWQPSFSVGWNIANEAFFESAKNVVNVLKPRFSWGRLGNQNTDALYPFYLTQNVRSNVANWLIGGARPTIAYTPGMISSFLTWEKVYNTNIGLDAALLRNRLNITFEYFNRLTEDMVGPPAEVGAVLGISLPNTNNAKLQNKGWELAIGWNDRKEEFKYSIGFNISDNRAKVLSYPNPSYSLSTFYNGLELGSIWGYKTQGIAKSDQEMADWLAKNNQTPIGSNWQEGDIMYRDLNGDSSVNSGSNTLNDPGDLSIIGNSNPRLRFGFSISAEYKGFDVGIFLQGVAKRDYWLGGNYFWGASGNLWQSVGFKEHLDYYRPANSESIFGPNVDSYYPRPYMGGRSGKNEYVQTRYLQNAAYMRLKNIQLGYTFSPQLLQRIHLQRLRLYISGENLFTITKLAKMYDPEVLDAPWGSGRAYPLSKTFSFGLNLSF